MAEVVVVGSANADLVFTVERIPGPGETVLSSGRSLARGGKGQNQAVAAARAGAATTFVGAVGEDEYGALTRSGMAEDVIATQLLRTVDSPTGTALIAVEPGGENTIIVDAGANSRLDSLTAGDLDAIAAADVLLMQLEIPMTAVLEAAAAARRGGARTILNAAPAAALPAELLDALDVLVVNEHEADIVARSARAELTELVPTVVVTLGSRGAELRRAGAEPIRVPAPVVPAVDATGAGDTFCGAFAAMVASGTSDEEALEVAVTAASLSVQRPGAVPSIPTAAQIAAARDHGKATGR